MRSAFLSLLEYLEYIDIVLWGVFGVPLVLSLGIYFSWKSRLLQFRALPRAFKDLFFEKSDHSMLLSFFASVGGSVGIGNVVGVCTALQIGGPGSIFWLWLGACTGTLVKYAEVYLAMRFKGTYNGMVSYILAAFNSMRIAQLAAFLSCIYGVEIYQFNVIRDLIHETWAIPSSIVSFVLLVSIFMGIKRGIRGVGAFAAKVIPVFLFVYFLASIIILFVYRAHFLDSIKEIFWGIFHPPLSGHSHAFNFLTAASQGMARGCYASDMGLGYSGIVYASSSGDNRHKKARSILVEPLFDSFGVCTLSLFVVLVTGVWKTESGSSFLVQQALGSVFLYAKPLFAIMISLLGYSTILTFLVTGIESARFLGGDKGVSLYLIIAICSWIGFSFVDARVALVCMSLCAFSLVTINLTAFFFLRSHIEFDAPEEK